MRAPLPLRRDLAPGYFMSLLAAAGMAAVSLAGLIFPAALYPTPELRRSFLSNDVVNLLIGAPCLLGAMALARRGRLPGLLFWPGALFYTTYTYIAYAVAIPQMGQRLTYAGLAILSAASIAWLLASMDGPALRQRLAGKTPERFTGWVLLGLGLLFFLRSAWQAASGWETLARPDQGVLVADLASTPFWMAGGILLLRKQPLGTGAAAGLLFQASMLFVGLLAFFILQPFLAGEPFAAVDFLVVLAMGLVCFIPLGLFIRGVVK